MDTLYIKNIKIIEANVKELLTQRCLVYYRKETKNVLMYLVYNRKETKNVPM